MGQFENRPAPEIAGVGNPQSPGVGQFEILLDKPETLVHTLV